MSTACPIAPSRAARRAACAASSTARPRAASGRRFGSSASLMRIPKPDTILVQNPPAFPTLFVAWLASRLRGARFVIDWHNLSHTIAAVKVGERHRAVKAIARSERRWAKRADAHIDRVEGARGMAGARVQGESRRRLRSAGRRVHATVADDAASVVGKGSPRTLSSERSRPPIVVCPTSWTPDEDFDLLLEALERAERQLSQRQRRRRRAAGRVSHRPRRAARRVRGARRAPQLQGDCRQDRVARAGRLSDARSAWPISGCACINRRPVSICR